MPVIGERYQMKIMKILEKAKSGELKNLKYFVDMGYELSIYEETDADGEITNDLLDETSVFRALYEILGAHGIKDGG